MANTHALKARIKGVESIRQITRSMKMVAASKLRRVQTARGALNQLAEKSRDMLESALGRSDKLENPFLLPREEPGSLCFVLFIGNRGLCGVYNSALLKYLEEQVKRCGREALVVVCGSWGQDIIEASGLNVLRRFSDMSDVPSAREAEELSEYLKELYLEGKAGEIALIYQSYRSILQQQPCVETLLPLSPPEERGERAEYIFEPDQKSVIDALVELYISSSVFSVMLEARMGEHAARMSSMSAASDSTDELMAKLRQQLNHLRQAAITTEISEIVSGAQALNGGK